MKFKNRSLFLAALFVAAVLLLWNRLTAPAWKLDPELASVHEIYCWIRDEDSYESREAPILGEDKERFISVMTAVKTRKILFTDHRIRADASKAAAKWYVHFVILKQAVLDVYVEEDGRVMSAELALWDSDDSYSIRNAEILKPVTDPIIASCVREKAL